MLLNCGVGEDSWESLGLQRDQTSQSWRKSTLNIHWKDLLKLKLQYFSHLMWRATSLEKALMLGKIEGKRRSGQQRMRWLDGITASKDKIWANSGRQWRTGKPGMLQSMGLQRVRCDLATDNNNRRWTGRMMRGKASSIYLFPMQTSNSVLLCCPFHTCFQRDTLQFTATRLDQPGSACFLCHHPLQKHRSHFPGPAKSMSLEPSPHLSLISDQGQTSPHSLSSIPISNAQYKLLSVFSRSTLSRSPISWYSIEHSPR